MLVARMRLPSLFRRENTSQAALERQERVERALTDGLRALAGIFKQVADAVEQRRLQRSGYEKQTRTLERTAPERSDEK